MRGILVCPSAVHFKATLPDSHPTSAYSTDLLSDRCDITPRKCTIQHIWTHWVTYYSLGAWNPSCEVDIMFWYPRLPMWACLHRMLREDGLSTSMQSSYALCSYDVANWPHCPEIIYFQHVYRFVSTNIVINVGGQCNKKPTRISLYDYVCTFKNKVLFSPHQIMPKCHEVIYVK